MKTYKYLTIHYVPALNAPQKGVSFVMANIPAENEEKAIKWVDNDPNYWIERHNHKYTVRPVN